MTTTKMTLYDVAKEGAELDEILSANGGELSPELEERLDSFLRGGHAKIDAACKVVQSITASSQACLDEAKRLNERASMYINEADRLKKRILGAVDAAFDGKVKTAMFTVWGQTSAPAVSFDVAPDADLASIQRLYPSVVRTKYELDKATLKSMRAQGHPLPSAISVIEGEGTRYLRIK